MCRGRRRRSLFAERTLLDSWFYADGDPLGLRPRLISAMIGDKRSQSNIVTFGLGKAETVRTVQQGAHVGDLYGSERYARGEYGDARHVLVQAYWGQTAQHGLYVGADHKQTTADIGAQESAIRLTANAGRQTFYLGYAASSQELSSHSDLFTNILPLFIARPDAQWNQSHRQLTFGLLSPVMRGVTLEGSCAWEDAPGEIILADAAHQVALPLNSAGWSWALTLRVRASRQTQLYAFLQDSDLTGLGSARADTKSALGETHTTYGVRNGGFAASREFGGTGRLNLTLALSSTRLDTHAYRLNPLPLGFAPESVDRVGYYVTGQLVQREYGLQWKQQFSRGHNLAFDYRWIETPFRVSYGYTAGAFLLGTARGSTFTLPSARGHIARLAYVFPARPLLIGLNASQIIPISGGAPHSSVSGSLPRHASGGWNLQAEVSLPF